MSLTRIATVVAGLLALSIGASFLVSSAASINLPPISLGYWTAPITANDLKPAICADLDLQTAIGGSGTISGTAGSDLITGSAGADVIHAGEGDNCVLSGDGNDRIHSGAGDDVIHGGGGFNICLAGGGSNTLINCHQTTVVQLLGSWQTGLNHARPAGDDRLLVFLAANWHSHPNQFRTVESVTYGGQSLTLIDTVTENNNPRLRIEIWVLKEAGIAAATSGAFAVTWSGSPHEPMYTHGFFRGVHQGTSTGLTAKNTDGTGALTISTSALSAAYGDMVVFGVQANAVVTYAMNNGFVQGSSQSSGGVTTLAAAYQMSEGPSDTPSATASADPGKQAILGMVIKVALVE